MTDLELIFGLLAVGSHLLTIIKIARKHTKWYWNLAPYLGGFTMCLWVAWIFGR